jgi:hypothetical protein
MAYRSHENRFGSSRRRHLGIGDIAEELRAGLRTIRRGLRAAEATGLLLTRQEPGCKPIVSISSPRGPKTKAGHKPLYGPIPWAWWVAAARLPSRALQVATICWLLAGWERSAEFELMLSDWAEFGLSRFSASRGLDALVGARLISAVRRRGRPPVVTILDPSDTRSRLNGVPCVIPAS